MKMSYDVSSWIYFFNATEINYNNVELVQAEPPVQNQVKSIKNFLK